MAFLLKGDLPDIDMRMFRFSAALLFIVAVRSYHLDLAYTAFDILFFSSLLLLSFHLFEAGCGPRNQRVAECMKALS